MSENYESATKKLPVVRASIRYIPKAAKTTIYEHIVGPHQEVLKIWLGMCHTHTVRGTVEFTKAALSEGGQWNGKSVLFAQTILEIDEFTLRDRGDDFYLGSLYVAPKADPPAAISLPDLSRTVLTPQSELVEEEEEKSP